MSCNSKTINALSELAQHATEGVTYCVSFVGLLVQGETITSPTLTQETGNATLSSPSVLAEDFQDNDGFTTPAGKGVQFKVSNTTAGVKHKILVSATVVGATGRAGNIRTVRCCINGAP